VIEGRYLGLDVGGTKVASAVLDDGRLLDAGVEPVEKADAETLLAQLEHIIGERGRDVRAVGVGVPSVIEFATGRVRHSVNLPLRDVPLRSLLTERTGRPVFVENDASCAALAEAFEDGELVCAHLVMITVGTGVGGGLVLDGRLYRGATGAAGEIGHTSIGSDLSDGAPMPDGFPTPGSLEALAAGTELDRLARSAARAQPDGLLGRRLADAGKVDGHDVVALATDGDPAAIHALRVLGARLGIGIANVVNLLDPLEVVVGGGVSAAGELLLEPAREVAARYTLPGVGTRCTIRLARHGVRAGVLGAALIAAQEFHGAAVTTAEGPSPAA
jgi:glucokinase